MGSRWGLFPKTQKEGKQLRFPSPWLWALAAAVVRTALVFHFRVFVLALGAVIRNFLPGALVLALAVFSGLIFLLVAHFQSRPLRPDCASYDGDYASDSSG